MIISCKLIVIFDESRLLKSHVKTSSEPLKYTTLCRTKQGILLIMLSNDKDKTKKQCPEALSNIVICGTTS